MLRFLHTTIDRLGSKGSLLLPSHRKGKRQSTTTSDPRTKLQARARRQVLCDAALSGGARPGLRQKSPQGKQHIATYVYVEALLPPSRRAIHR